MLCDHKSLSSELHPAGASSDGICNNLGAAHPWCDPPQVSMMRCFELSMFAVGNGLQQPCSSQSVPVEISHHSQAQDTRVSATYTWFLYPGLWLLVPPFTRCSLPCLHQPVGYSCLAAARASSGIRADIPPLTGPGHTRICNVHAILYSGLWLSVPPLHMAYVLWCTARVGWLALAPQCFP
jgi:hypothetical protein